MTCRGLLLLSAALVASASGSAFAQPWSPDMHAGRIAFHAAANGIPPSLIRRVIHIESKGNPTLVSKGNYGLMQIRLGTAKAMGYTGDADGLLNPDVNMTYAVKYLAGAYRAANGSEDGAIRNYQRGYYVSAKAKGFSPYDKPPIVAVNAINPATTETPMPPAPRSPLAALLTPAETPAEIVRARMPKPQAPTADIVDTNRSFDTKPAMTATTTAMAPSDQRPVQPKPVKVEHQIAARPAPVKSDAAPVEAKANVARTDAAKSELSIPLPRPAQRPAAPVLASVEPAAPALELQKIEAPKVEAQKIETPNVESAPAASSTRASRRERQKAKLAAVPPVAVSRAAVAAAPADGTEKPAAQSGDSKSLWSAFKSELSTASGTSATPARTAAAPTDPAPAAAPHKKKSAKEAEPFNLLTYMKKKIAPDTKPEKKRSPQT